MKTYIVINACPFAPGDLVECVHTKVRSFVQKIEEEHVFCVDERGVFFYRTWSHDNGGLTLIQKSDEA